MAKTIGAKELPAYELGKIDALKSVGLSNTDIAKIMNRAVSTVQKHVSALQSEESANTTEILRSIDPVAAVVMAESMASSDEHVKLKAATTHLKGRGHYSEHVKQTTRSIPDSEINAGLTDMLLQALSATAVDTEYTVSDPVDSNLASPGASTVDIEDTPDVGHGRQTTQNQPTNNAEAPAKQLPSTRPTAVEQVRNSGETLGKLIAKENAKRFTANASNDSITGATSIPGDTRDERG